MAKLSFRQWVKQQDPEREIDHSRTWCGCALGEYARVIGEFKTRFDEMKDVGPEENPVMIDPDGAAYEWRIPAPVFEELNSYRPETYGELAELMAEYRFDEKEWLRVGNRY